MTQTSTPAALFFDFDGVLADTLAVKTSAYKEIFTQCGERIISEIVAYHQLHAGISRVEKIAHVHRNILHTPDPDTAVSRDVATYSRLVFEKVVAAAWLPGAKEFLERHWQEAPIFVISGTPQTELREVVKRRAMGGYFREVLGAPIRKPEHIRNLVDRYRLDPGNCVFIGDALTDYHAARETGVPFIGIQGETNLPADALVLPDCTGLDKAIARLGQPAD